MPGAIRDCEKWESIKADHARRDIQRNTDVYARAYPKYGEAVAAIRETLRQRATRRAHAVH